MIETPFPASELRLVPNTEQSVLSDFAKAEGFRITGFRIGEHLQRYDTDFGFREASAIPSRSS